MRVALVEYVGWLSWMASSLKSAQIMQKGHFSGTYTAEQIHKWNRAFITDRTILPVNDYGTWN